MKANWVTVTDHLMARRRMGVAGALRLATPTNLADGVLTLGFDAVHETLRKRCERLLKDTAAEALSELAGETLQCEFVSTGEGSQAASNLQAPRQQALSTAQKNEIHNDPAVQGVLSFFDGEVVGIRRDHAPPEPVAADEDEDEGASQ